MKEYLRKIYCELDAVTHCSAAGKATLEKIEDAKRSIRWILSDGHNGIFSAPQSVTELKQKYPGKVPGEILDAYLRDAFAAYEAQGFRECFKDAFGIDEERDGCPFTVLRRAEPNDPYMELSACRQSLPAWVIEFPDGERITAEPEEVIDMPGR